MEGGGCTRYKKLSGCSVGTSTSFRLSVRRPRGRRLRLDKVFYLGGIDGNSRVNRLPSHGSDSGLKPLFFLSLRNSKLLSIMASMGVVEISGADTAKEEKKVKITVWDADFREVIW